MTVPGIALFLFILFNLPVIGRVVLWVFNAGTNVLLILLFLMILLSFSVFLIGTLS